MELTKEQLLQIDNYIYVCGIKYYDVRMEIVDHFANILEQKLEENPDLEFKSEIENIHKSFSDRGFSRLLKEKTKLVTKKFYKQSLKHLVTFFKFPKIILTVFIFVFLFKTQLLFKEAENFFLSLFIFGAVLMIITGIKTLNRNKDNKFLTLSFSLGFFQIFHLFIMGFQFSYSRSLESLENNVHNNLFIAYFVFIILFFLSGEHVYEQNKKLVKEQYPSAFV